MAIITSYPVAQPETPDYILGVRVEDESMPTKLFPIQNLIELVSEEIPAGPQGPQGPIGPQGPQGIPGVSGTYGLFAQTALSTPVVFASGEATLIGTGVGTLSVPANAFTVGNSFTVRMCGTITCVNNEILHIHVRSNGITIIDALQYTLPAITGKYWDLVLDFTVTKIGGAGTAELFANGIFSYNKNAAVAMEGTHFGQVSNTTFNTTVTNTIDITAQWITNNAANTIRSQNFVMSKTY